MATTSFIRWFCDIGLSDVPLVGGKNASLGELARALTSAGVLVPDGFAITADAYRHFLEGSGLTQTIPRLLAGLQTTNLADLAARGLAIRHAVLAAELPADLQEAIVAAYEQLGHGDAIDVAARRLTRRARTGARSACAARRRAITPRSHAFSSGAASTASR